jgi:hypothetical protein
MRVLVMVSSSYVPASYGAHHTPDVRKRVVTQIDLPSQLKTIQIGLEKASLRKKIADAPRRTQSA